jgi:hypothetical protein
MKLPLLALALAGLLLSSGLPLFALLPSEAPVFADAQALSKEGSWALAAERYAALQPGLQGEDARWGAFLLAKARLHGDAEPSDWNAKQAWRDKQDKEFRSLLAPYDRKEFTRDELWCQIRQELLSIHVFNMSGEENNFDTQLDILDVRRSIATNPEASHLYYLNLVALSEQYAQQSGGLGYIDPKNNKAKPRLERFLKHFHDAAENAGLTQDERALCLLAWGSLQYYAAVPGVPWNDISERLKGSRWESTAHAYGFLTEILCPGQTPPPDRKLDIPECLDRLAGLNIELCPWAELTLPGRAKALLDQLESAWKGPRLQIRVPNRILPGEPLRFVYGETGFHSLRCELFACSPEQWMAPVKSPLRGTDEMDNFKRGRKALRSWIVDLPNPLSREWESAVESVSAPLAPGLYMLVVSGWHPEATHAQIFKFTCGNLAASVIGSDKGDPALFLYDCTNFAALANKDAFLWIKNPSDSSGTQHRLNTDGQGQTSVPLSWLNNSRTDSIIMHEGSPAVLTLYGNPRTADRIQGDVFVERPLFRPGESARWKLILRKRLGGKWILPDKELSLLIRLGDTTLSEISGLKLDAHGSVDGLVQIPPSARPGSVYLTLHEKGSDKNHEEMRVHLFRIDSFVPPPVSATLELASRPDSVRPGGDILIRAKADYFSGGPASNALALLKLSVPPDYRMSEKEKDQAFDAWKQKLEKQEFRLSTNAEGKAEFQLHLPPFVKEGTSLEAELQLAPQGSGPLSAHALFHVSEAGAFLQKGNGTKPVLVSPGAAHRFPLLLVDGQGKPFVSKVIVKLVEVTWVERWLDPRGNPFEGHPSHIPASYNDELLDDQGASPRADGWKCAKADYEESPVQEQSLTSDTEGSLNATFSLPHAGVWGIQVWREGKRLRLANDYEQTKANPFRVFCADAKTKSLSLAPHESLLVAPEEPCAAGARNKLLLVFALGRHFGLLSIAGENQVSSQRVAAEDRIALLDITVPDDSLGSYQLQVHDVQERARHGYSNMLLLRKSPDSKRASLSLSPDSPQARPGQSLRFVAKSRTQSGFAVPAQIAFSVSDEAVNFLSGDSQASDPVFDQAVSPAFSVSYSSGLQSRADEPKIMSDPRPGFSSEDSDEFVTLSAFAVEDRGYIAGSSIAGTALEPRGEGMKYASVQTDIPELALVDSFIQSMEPPPSSSLRRHFSSTAFWSPDVQTDPQGQATIEFRLPDNLTSWRLRAYAVSDDLNRFATASSTFTASIPFQARLQLPRFLIEGDRSGVLATFVNRTNSSLQGEAALKVSGIVTLASSPANKQFAVPAKQEVRNVWTLQATAPGKADVQLQASAGAESDMMELSIPVFEDGTRLPLAASALLQAGESSKLFTLSLPDPLDPSRTELHLQLTPSLAGAVIDALPFLIDYPYGCVEQTMNRFMPAVVVMKSLGDLGFDPALLEKRILARNVMQGKQAAGFKDLHEVVQKSLERLQNAERDDHGFGWWPGSGTSDLWMSAYVVWGLELAQQAGTAIPAEFSQRVRKGLLSSIGTRTDDVAAWALAALCQGERKSLVERKRMSEIWEAVFASRQTLSPSGRASLAIASDILGSRDQREILLRNMENAVVRSQDAGLGELAQWGLGRGYWRAMDGAVESTALSMMALMRIKPDHPLLPAAARWLVLNRQSANWNNSRDTAFAVLALVQYATQTGEARPGGEVELLVNGISLGRTHFNQESLLSGPTQLTVQTSLLKAGENRFELRRLKGDGPVYALALSSAWARGDGIRAQGHLLSLERNYTLERAEASASQSPKTINTELKGDGKARTGERLWAELSLSAPQDFEYLMIEIPKPAGCEPLNPLSAWDAKLVSGNNPSESADGRLLYREEFDDRSVIFIDSLPAGNWTLRLGLQAVFSGDYRALPAKAKAMYVPEIRTNSSAQRIIIE